MVASEPQSQANPPPRVPDHELLRLIGRGSYGEVWLARNVMGTFRAVKIVYRERFETSHPFEREFAGIQKFEPVSRSHEGLINVLHVGRSMTGDSFYYVMELADDEKNGGAIDPQTYQPKTLGSEIAQRGRLPFDECLNISLSLASALGHLHRRGLIHRDLKPSNIIFVNSLPKLADIGLVSALGESRSFVGTEGFIPPEGPGSIRADLYSLGKVLYEISTGKDRQSFPELPTEWLEFSHEQPELEFHEILLKACEGQADKRHASAEELHAEMALLQSGRSVRKLRALERRLQTAKKLGRVAAIVALLAAAGYCFAQIEARRARQAERTANEHLAKAYLAQARAERMSGVPGQRVESLKAAVAAAKLQPSTHLRNEVVAALALLDVEDWYEYKGPTHSPAFAPSLERYALGNQQGEIIVRRVPDDAEVMRLVGSRSGARNLQFSPDGRFLAATFQSGRLIVWNLATGTLVINPKFGVISWGVPCVFGPDGRTVGIRVPEPRVAFFDLSTGAELEPLRLSTPARFFALRPDGQILALAHEDATEVELWDLKSRTLQSKLTHPVPVESVAWHYDGRRLAVGGWAGHLYLWDTETTNRLELHGHTGLIPTVLFDHRGGILVSSSWDGTTRFWDAGTGQQLLMSYSGYAMGFSPDDQRLAYVREGMALGIWRVHGGSYFRTIASPIGSPKPSFTHVDLSPNGRWLASANRDDLHVWDFASGRLVHSQPLRNGHSAHFAPDGQSFITVSFSDLRRWPLMNGVDPLSFEVGRPRVLMNLPENSYPRVTVTRGNRHTMTISHSRGVTRLDLDEAAAIPLPEGKAFEYAATSPDTNWLVVSQREGATQVWDLQRCEVVRELPGRGGVVSFSPTGRWLVLSSDASYEFYETGSWQRRHIIQTQAAPALTPAYVAFSRHGTLVALAVSRRLVQIVDSASGREIVTLTSPRPQYITSLAFSPDDKTLLVANDQNEIQVWELDKLRRELAALNLDWKD
jgi:WD40 repeat protein